MDNKEESLAKAQKKFLQWIHIDEWSSQRKDDTVRTDQQMFMVTNHMQSPATESAVKRSLFRLL